MDGIFALILIVYVLSAVFQAVLGKDARKRQRGAGAPWPRTHIPGRTPEEDAHVPDEFPFPFPFEEVFGEKQEAESSFDEMEPEDVSGEPVHYDEKETIRAWEDKSWGSLGPSLEGQSLEGPEGNELYSLHIADDFADDFDDMELTDDAAEFMALAEPVAFEGWKPVSTRAVIQGIIMSEVLKRPKMFSRYPIIRK